MSCVSARWSCASAPRSTENRAPEIFAAAGRSSRLAANATWSRGSKLKEGGSRQRRSSTLSASVRPAGTSSSGTFGIVMAKSASSARTDSKSAFAAPSRVPKSPTAAINGFTSWPAAFAAPMRADAPRRSFCSRSVCNCSSLRRVSKVRKRSASSTKPRRPTLAAMPSTSRRSRPGSITPAPLPSGSRRRPRPDSRPHCRQRRPRTSDSAPVPTAAARRRRTRRTS